VDKASDLLPEPGHLVFPFSSRFAAAASFLVFFHLGLSRALTPSHHAGITP